MISVVIPLCDEVRRITRALDSVPAFNARPWLRTAANLGLAVFPDMATSYHYDISRRLGFQSMAYDFLLDARTGRRLLTEISCVYPAELVFNSEGHFDNNFNWHVEQLLPQDAILEDVLSSLRV